MRRVNFIGAAADHADARTQLAQNLQRRHDITDTGQVFNQTFIGSQNGSRQNGNGSIFGTADVDIAMQRGSPAYHEFFQV